MSQPSQSPEMTFPIASDLGEISPSANPAVLQWQYLASMDRQSPYFLPLLSSLTAANNRFSTTELCDADANIALSFMDEVIRSGRIPSEYEHNILNTMRKLAYNSGQVPVRYQVDRYSLNAETAVFASGAFTYVRRGMLGGRAVAIKTLRSDRKVDKNESQRLFCKEAIIWMSLFHPNILQLIGVDVNSQGGQCSMISEMMVNGNIREYIRQNSVNRLRLLKEVATGLCYLHERGIVHGDLKGNNILITNDTPPRACLADFGLATLAPSTEGVTTTNTAGGTVLYMSPELLFPTRFGNQGARPTKPADVYALGMVIFEVLTGLQPFYDRKWVFYEVMHHVVEGVRPTKPGGAEQIGFGSGTWELVEKCWKEEPTKRPTVERVLTHLTRVSTSLAAVGPALEELYENSPVFHPPEGETQLSNSTVTTKRSTSSANPTIPTNPTAKSSTDRGVMSSSTNTTRTQFSNFAQHGETIPSFHGLGPGSSPLPPSDSQYYILAKRRTILLEWRNLEKIKSIDRQRFAPLVDVEENRKVALKFWGRDAATVINAIDKALRQTECPEETRLHALMTLRQLAGNTCQVPKSYLTPGWPRYSVKEEISANGAVADIREGRLGSQVVAVKTFRTSKETSVDNIHKAFCEESVLWMNVSHLNILKLIAVDIKPSDKKFSMISEMMTNGNIMKYIHTRKANRLCLLRDVASGLEHLHRLGIVHGDIKGPNILIDNQEPPRACISDFGLSAFISLATSDPTTYKGGRGTLGYMAPELCWGGGKYTKETDIYAFGMVVYEVVTGASPFGRRRLHLMLSSSPWRPDEPADPVGSGFGKGTWRFLEQCWSENPQRRPTAREALEHFKRVGEISQVIDPTPIPSVAASEMISSSPGSTPIRFWCNPCSPRLRVDLEEIDNGEPTAPHRPDPASARNPTPDRCALFPPF